MGFPDSSVGKESSCNERDPGSIPGLGRSPGEGKGYPLQYSWTSLVAQLVKNSPAMQETWVQSLGWEDPLEKEKAIHSSILFQRIPDFLVHGVTRSQTRLSDLKKKQTSYHSAICLNNYSSSIKFSWHPCKKSIDINIKVKKTHKGLFLDSQFFSTDLYFF